MDFNSVWYYIKKQKIITFSSRNYVAQFTKNNKIKFSGKKTERPIGYEKFEEFYILWFIQGKTKNKFFLNDGPKKSENQCYADYLKNYFFPYLKSNFHKIELRPYKKLVAQGLSNESEKTIYYETQGNQWGDIIGLIEDAIKRAISLNKYTMDDIAFLVGNDISKISTHINSLKEKGIDIIDEDGVLKISPRHSNQIEIKPRNLVYEEGGEKILKQHRIRERSPHLIKMFKETLNDYSCSICGFSFKEMYGELGEQFIEAHHINPIAELEQRKKVSISDLIAVCSNCHRMLHRRQPPLKKEELKQIISKNKEST